MNNVEAMERNAIQFRVAKALESAASLDDAELDRLALLPPIEYGPVRKPLADQLGISVAYLDAAVTSRKKELIPPASAGSGRPLEMATIVPAEHPDVAGCGFHRPLGSLSGFL